MVCVPNSTLIAPAGKMTCSLKDLSLLWGTGKAWFEFNMARTFIEALD